MKTNAGMLKRFYESDKYWPKGYTLYELLITVEGDGEELSIYAIVGGQVSEVCIY